VWLVFLDEVFEHTPPHLTMLSCVGSIVRKAKITSAFETMGHDWKGVQP